MFCLLLFLCFDRMSLAPVAQWIVVFVYFPRQAMTPYSLKGLPVIIQVSYSYNNQDWEPIRTWQLCSPRASIHSLLHVQELQTRFSCRVAGQSLEPMFRRSGFETETSGAEVKVRGEIFIVLVYMVLCCLFSFSNQASMEQASKMVHNFSCVPFWRVFFFFSFIHGYTDTECF